MKTHDDHVMDQKQKSKVQQGHLDDAEENLKTLRTSHVNLTSRQGQIIAEENVRVRGILLTMYCSPCSRSLSREWVSERNSYMSLRQSSTFGALRRLLLSARGLPSSWSL